MGAPAARSGSRPTGGAADASPAKPSIPSAFSLEELASALANFPANGKPPMDNLHWELVLSGFIMEHEIKKPCRDCGTSLTDSRYFKLTKGGHMFLAAAAIAMEARSGETAKTGSTRRATARPRKGIAQ